MALAEREDNRCESGAQLRGSLLWGKDHG